MSDEVTLRREGKDKNLKAPTLKQNRLKERRGHTNRRGKGFTAKGLCNNPKNLTIKLATNFKTWILMGGGGVKGVRRSVL